MEGCKGVERVKAVVARAIRRGNSDFMVGGDAAT